MNPQAYLYRWTNLSTGKWYIGSRTAKGCHPNDGYICSSKIKFEIQEYPLDWSREVLVIGDPNYILLLESSLLHLLDAKHDPLSFNKHNGDGKFTTCGKTDTPRTRLKKSLAHRGKHVGVKNNFYGKKHTKESIQKSIRNGSENGMYGKLGEASPNYGAVRSEKTKKLISISKSGGNHPSKNPKNHWVCEHCGGSGTVKANYTRWHGEKCKSREGNE